MCSKDNRRSERLRKQRERDCARRNAQSAHEREVTLQQKSTSERERLAAETPDARDRQVHTRIQHSITNLCDISPLAQACPKMLCIYTSFLYMHI